MLQIENISKSYGKVQALSQISFTIERGTIVGLLGVNGAGKSTLMNILSTLVKPDTGSVMYEGNDCLNDSQDYKTKIGYLSEDNPLYEDMYVREYLNYVAGLYRTPKNTVSWYMQQAGLIKESGKKIKTLSKGNRQRVGIAQALLHNPEIVIMDEATSGLDPNQREALVQLLMDLSENRIILFSTHILQEIKMLCSRFILIDKGEIVADENITNISSIEDTFHQLTNENNS